MSQVTLPVTELIVNSDPDPALLAEVARTSTDFIAAGRIADCHRIVRWERVRYTVNSVHFADPVMAFRSVQLPTSAVGEVSPRSTR